MTSSYSKSSQVIGQINYNLAEWEIYSAYTSIVAINIGALEQLGLMIRTVEE